MLHAIDDPRAREPLAREGGQPLRRHPFPIWPAYGEEEIAAATEVLRTGRFSSLSGTCVRTFENEWAEFQGVRHAIAASSGTCAIHTALAAVGVGPGDEVVVTPHSFIASVTPVLHAGAIPVFADIDRRTFNMTAETIDRAITPRTKAIVLVHLNGHPADPAAVAEVAGRRGVLLIEDCAQAPGARWEGQLVGTFGAVAAYSFWEDKIITTVGEGGMVATDDDEVAESARMLVHHGEAAADEDYYAGERLYVHHKLGYNFRMAEVQGAIGSVQLRRLPGYVQRRREVAGLLSAALEGVPGIQVPYIDPRGEHAFYKYIILLDRAVIATPVFEFVTALRAEGIPVTRRYPTPIHRQPIFMEHKGFGESRWPFPDDAEVPPAMPVAEEVARDAIQVTVVNPVVSDEDVHDAAVAIAKVANACASNQSI